ncbi:MAG: hypothetical protein ACRDTE_12250, partial [Pseudonocardiaceae bacterium]
MTVARSVSDVLDQHVDFEVECIDRMYLNVYQPRLQHPLGVVGFLRSHLGYQFASTALVDPISKAFVADIHRFAAQHEVGLVEFARGQRKDDLARQYLAGFTAEEGVLFIGRAQEKNAVFRTEKRRNPHTGASYPWIVRSTGVINQFYFYCVDADFGPFFLKFSSYFPCTAKLCINGNEWAKRQATRAGIDHTALDNGFASCADPAALQAVCDQLDAAKIDALLRKWLAILPHPFTAQDRAAGYRYDVSILQAEFSLTHMLDQPRSGRVFFEEVIRENLDIGRPDSVGLIFDRQIRRRGKHPTPSRFRTRVLTAGVTPSLHVDHKHSKIKQYHKEGRALRTETTINDTGDFDIGRRLGNLPALREVGFSANRRLLDVERLTHDPAIGDGAITALTTPAVVGTQRASALPFGTPRTHALLAALLVFGLLPAGFRNRDLRAHLAPLLGLDPALMTAGRMSYELRRLRLHGLIERIPGSHRYRLTHHGLTTAIFFTRAHARLIRPALAELTDPDPPPTGPIRTALNRLNTQIDRATQHAHL